jgi:segregation and condensation protein B
MEEDVPQQPQEEIAQEQEDESALPPEKATSGFPEEMRVLEAVLFASDEVLSPATLKAIIPGEPDGRALRRLVSSLNARLQKERHPFEVVELGGGYQFRTIPYYHPWVRKLLKERVSKKLSVQALECLAIIAYKQPISKAEIESIRGVLSDGAMKTLLERRMVTIVGRSEKPGRPLQYGTTHEFLEYFGVNKLSDLPKIEEFEAMAKEKMEELTDAERALLDAAPDEADLAKQAALGQEPASPQAAAAPAAENAETASLQTETEAAEESDAQNEESAA